MKVLTLLGTRPEIIRLSLIIEKLDRLCDHVLVHTGQNFDASLSDVFFAELGVRAPDEFLGVRGASPAEQIGQILVGCERVFAERRPDRLLILGDTNSALGAIVAKRMAIPVFHMEAGNRCFDDRVPEETNRRIIDHSSDILLPYTEHSRRHLLREGFPDNRIYVTGNPITEVIQRWRPRINEAEALHRLGLDPRRYLLVTMHRAENVDVEDRLRALIDSVTTLQARLGVPAIVSTHPRTRARMEAFGLAPDNGGVRFLPPFGFVDFVALEANALCVLSDSGTVQEECAILGTPNVTIRDTTERPETVECGSNFISGVTRDGILAAADIVLDLPPDWQASDPYRKANVSDTVVRIVLGHHATVAGPGAAGFRG
ncbi:non-hydrolyzing UDP-N-acetylglucosamine 2-epimerase [Azospirillum halopraeferens]|uniref:non-hydrolyzing UDP-N-acetylglucosamine 2-epimerase n=1 Tax=Azospirillum halopraeferens TaxID=34010 RepID=UPI000426175A|nr:UDP-N-acetylglucosamine 2-epimerase (non-hydrolyzing) [Azospirillum halopraeferens]